MTWWTWFSRMTVVLCFAWIVAFVTYVVLHPSVLPLHWGRVFYAAVFMAPFIVLAGVAKLVVRIHRGYWASLPPLEIPPSWETALRIAVWTTVVISFAALTLKLLGIWTTRAS